MANWFLTSVPRQLLKKWKNISCLWMGRLNIVKNTPPQTDLQSQCHFCQNHSWLSVGIYKLTLKFLWKCEGSKIAKMVLRVKSKVRGLTLPNLKTYYKLQKLRMYGIGLRIDILVNGIQFRVLKETHKFMVNWLLTKMSKQFSGGKKFFFQQIVLGQLDSHMEKKWNWFPT